MADQIYDSPYTGPEIDALLAKINNMPDPTAVVTTTTLNTALASYATQSWVTGQGYITSSALSSYATQAWVTEQGYITSSALSGYATQSWVTNTALSGYATRSWVTNTALSDYATESWVTGTALSGYATEEWVTETALADYATQAWVGDNYLSSTSADTAAALITFNAGITVNNAVATFNYGATTTTLIANTSVGTASTKVPNIYATNIGTNSYPVSLLIATTIGSTTVPVTRIYASNLGSSSTKVSNAYITNIGSSSSPTTNAFIKYLGSSSSKVIKAYIKELITDALTSTDITTENLTVTKAAYFFRLVIDELTSNKGAIIITAANAKVAKVVNNSTYYTVYFRAEDGEGASIDQSWKAGDLAICKTFNGLHAGSAVTAKYYWRKVIYAPTETVSITLDDGTTADCYYLNLSNASGEYDSGSVAPEAGDEIVQLGYTGNDDEARQCAIIISAYDTPDTDLTAPSFAMYRGIGSDSSDLFNLVDHRYTYMDANGSTFFGAFKVLSNGAYVDIDKQISLKVGSEGPNENFIRAADFYSSDDVFNLWTRVSSPTISSLTSYIYWSTAQYEQCSTLCMNLARYSTQVSHLLRVTQDIKSSKLGALKTGTTLCFSVYVLRDTITDTTVRFGLEALTDGVTITGVYADDDTIQSSGFIGSGTSRSYGQVYMYDKNVWHRIWVTMTCSSQTVASNFTIGMYAWRPATVTPANAPHVYWCMPKLEVLSSTGVPTAWVAMGDAARRTGIDIVEGEIHLEGVTTVNEGFAIDLNGNMEANNGTFAGFVRTKPRVIQSADIADNLLESDFIGPDHTDTFSGYSDVLWPYLSENCVSLDLLKTGAHIVFYDTNDNTFDALVHLPFDHPHLSSVYQAFDCAYYKGSLESQRGTSSDYSGPATGSETAWNNLCPELLKIKSFVGCSIEIANMTDNDIQICGLKGTLSTDWGATYLTIESPWQMVTIPTKAVLRATCVRETEGSSSSTFVEKIYWRPDSYMVLNYKYTAASLGLS